MTAAQRTQPAGFQRGLQWVAEGCYAWIQPDGGWGLSNSGLVVDDGQSLVIDTLFDLELTAEMLEAYRSLPDMRGPQGGAAGGGAPVGFTYLFNTHGNGDHYHGNQLLPEVRDIIASESAAADIKQQDVDGLRHNMAHLPGPVGDYLRGIFGKFDFAGIQVAEPTRTFSTHMPLELGSKHVDFVHVGPAHTPGDAIAYLPDRGVVYAGDALFIGGTPVIWAGPVQNWIDTCDYLLGLDADTYVPGHGPVTDKGGVAGVKAYLEYVKGEAEDRYSRGMTAAEAIRDIDQGPFTQLIDAERLGQNIINIYTHLDPDHTPPEVPVGYQAMAYLDGRPVSLEARPS